MCDILRTIELAGHHELKNDFFFKITAILLQQNVHEQNDLGHGGNC